MPEDDDTPAPPPAASPLSSHRSTPTFSPSSFSSSAASRGRLGSLSNGRSQSFPMPELARVRSAQERIDDILETARNRAESLSGTGNGTGNSPSPGLGESPPHMQPLLAVQRPGTAASAGISQNATPGSGGVVTSQPERAQPLGYQSIRAAPPPAAVAELRARKAALSDSRAREGGQPAPGRRDTSETSAGEDGDGKEEEAWWRATLRKFQSIELENKGSVARDHLALERTFLAWLRTSLAFASIGIAVTQLFRLNASAEATSSSSSSSSQSLLGLGKPLGATFLAISIAILFLGYQRYFQSQQWLMRGKFPASRGTVLLVSFIAFALTVASLVVVVAFTS